MKIWYKQYRKLKIKIYLWIINKINKIYKIINKVIILYKINNNWIVKIKLVII